MTSVRVNGESRHVPAGARLATLVTTLAPEDGGVAVAVNGRIVPRAHWHEREVHDGDDIEIVRAVQGG